MRSVLFVVTEFGRGGAETQILRVGAQLVLRGWKVTVLSLMRPEGFAAEAQAAGITLLTLAMRRGRPTARALQTAWSIVRATKPDVLVAFLYHAIILGALVGRMAHVPVTVASIRNSHFGGKNKLAILRGLLRVGLYDLVVTNSGRVADSLVQQKHLRRESVRVIPNGLQPVAPVDSHRRQYLRREIFGVDSSSFQWLAVGNFQPDKDYPNLVSAFSIAARSDPRMRLAIIGKGEPPPDVARALGSGREHAPIRLLGQRTDVPELLAAADAVVLASSNEGMPNVLMEALSTATPVVATQVGGVPEVVRHGSTGLLAPAQNANALAQAMIALARMPEERRREMGAHGRDDMVARYEISKIATQWESLFDEIRRSKSP